MNFSGACSWQTISISEFIFDLYETLKGRFSLLQCGIILPNFFIAQVGHSVWGSKDWKWSWNGGYEQCKIPNLSSFSLLLFNRHLKNIQKYVLPKFPLKQPHKFHTRPCKKLRGGARRNCTCHGVSISHASPGEVQGISLLLERPGLGVERVAKICFLQVPHCVCLWSGDGDMRDRITEVFRELNETLTFSPSYSKICEQAFLI